jgi:S-adenosylmethionine/arginine decarboxylase-like enzyme
MPHGGVAGFLLLDGCHMAVHTIPDRGILLFDALAPATSNARKALDVFVRRLPAAHVRTEQRARG